MMLSSCLLNQHLQQLLWEADPSLTAPPPPPVQRRDSVPTELLNRSAEPTEQPLYHKLQVGHHAT